MTANSENQGHGQDGLKITITTTAGKWQSAHFEPTDTVATVIAATLRHFHDRLNQTDAYELRKKDTEIALEETATLASLGVQNGDVFLLVKSTVGGGK